jgi:hypothetical protein
MRLRFTLALLFSLALFAGASKLALNPHSAPVGSTSSVVQIADDEGGSGLPDTDTVEQGPNGDGDVQG